MAQPVNVHNHSTTFIRVPETGTDSRINSRTKVKDSVVKGKNHPEKKHNVKGSGVGTQFLIVELEGRGPSSFRKHKRFLDLPDILTITLISDSLTFALDLSVNYVDIPPASLGRKPRR